MKNTLLLFVIGLFLIGCDSQTTTPEAVDTTETTIDTPTEAKVGMNNYAITWKWTTDDAQFVQDNSPTISAELTNLWKNGLVENAYYDVDAEIDKLDYFANIVFFLKADSEEEAGQILDKLTVVTKNIAEYTIHPVGLLWLDRKTDVINEQGVTESYVTVWKLNEGQTPAETVIQEQNDMILGLWNKGSIENVYFDIEGTQEANEKTDFVFFANANSMEEAEAICKSLPFHKNDIASYDIYRSGTFWMGKYASE